MRRRVAILSLTILTGAAVWLLVPERKAPVLKPVSELKIRITSSTAIPDPARVDTAGQWYFLDHISSGLAAFDSEKKKFVPRLAESWSTQPDGTHTFRLRPDAKFHDGTPIRARDVLWSIKRQVILKTSTHFPFWDYIAGCEGVTTLDDECQGLRATSDTEITIRLKTQTDSFFLQLASPETGIWSAKDMDPKTLKLTPTKYSGPYFVAECTDTSALLLRNEWSPLSREFPESPKRIRIVPTPLAKLDQALMNRDIDLTVRSYRPFGEPDWKKYEVGYLATTPSKIIYLYGTGRGERPLVGKDLVTALWKKVSDPGLVPSDSFLPFAERYGLTKNEFISELPEKSAKKLRLLCPADFFSEGFLDRIRSSAKGVGVDVEFFFLPSKEWSKAFDDPSAHEKYDFILASYAASERYPAVQLRYIAGNLTNAPIDLKPAEAPDLTDDRVTILKNYAKWLLHSRQAIPLFFTNTLFLHQKNLDMGAQPSTDAEIELWRVREKIAP
jgi:Bacterial extracellular solute-binding proteins, family 5 Middle